MNIFASSDLGSTDAVSVTSDGRFAAFQYHNKSIELWDLDAGSRVQALKHQIIGETHEMAPVLSLRGDRLLYVCNGNSRLMSLSDGKELELSGRMRAGGISFDNQRVVATYDHGSAIIDAESGRTLADLPDETRRLTDMLGTSPNLIHPRRQVFPEGVSLAAPQFSLNRKQVIALDTDGCLGVWNYRHPEPWWGVACLLEFWLTVGFACAFVWSLRRDRRGA